MQVYARESIEDKYVEEWFICIASGSGQSECSKVVSPYLVNIPYYVIANVIFFLFLNLKNNFNNNLYSY